jgi:ribonuclease BN (tRNA processing enzyme)
MIRLHVLGAGGAVFTPERGPAAYWVEVDGQGLLLDPGPGALVRLVRQPGAPDEVDAIDTVLLSHLHLDHTADLAPLLFALHSILARATAPLRLVGPPGLSDFLERLRGVYGSWLEPRCRPLELRELAAGDGLDLAGGGRAETFAAAHEETRFGAPCLGWSFRDREGRRLVYSGDTGPGDALREAAVGCELLLVECSTPDDLAVDGHLSPSRVADLARNARPGRVVLTHMYPLVAAQDPARTVTALAAVPCTAARDGEVFTVPDETENPS